MTSRAKVAMARDRADAAREEMLDTLGEIQARISPATLARNAVDNAASGAVDTVRKRPIASAAAAGALALFLARGWIARRITHRDGDGDPAR